MIKMHVHYAAVVLSETGGGQEAVGKQNKTEQSSAMSRINARPAWPLAEKAQASLMINAGFLDPALARQSYLS